MATLHDGQWINHRSIIPCVKAVRWFEAGIRSLLEGRLGRFFGARVQPVDIARTLSERMEDDVAIGAGKRYAPNVYRVFLAPGTLSSFESYRLALEEELAAGLSARGAARGLDFVGRVRVRLMPDASIRPERMRIEADRVDRHGVVVGSVGATTEAIRVDAAPAEAPQAMSIRHGGRRVQLPRKAGASLTIGRALESDVVVDGGTVSRKHARLIARGTHWMIEDLESTHGTWVNGRRISAAMLRDGDRIGLGTAMILVEGESSAAAAGSDTEHEVDVDDSSAPDGPGSPDADPGSAG